MLRDLAAAEGPGFEITNAELAERCKKAAPKFALDERGVSSALGIFRDLGFVAGEGHGAYRRLTFVPVGEKVELRVQRALRGGARGDRGVRRVQVAGRSTRGQTSLLARFNRPILPTAVH